MLYQRIKYFLEVAGCLSFTAAARNLYLSQQAVTKQIAALEAELGVKLFDRTTRHISLTPAGRQLRDDFVLINRQIEASLKNVRAMGGGGEHRLRVGFLAALSRRDVILPVTSFLFQNRAETNVELRLLDFQELRNQLLDGRLDICLTTSNDWKLWPGVYVAVMAQKQFQAVYSDSHPLNRVQRITLETLGAFDQLVLPKDNLLPGVEQWGRNVPCRKAVLCQDISTLLVRLELGEGFALLTKVFEGHENPHYRFWDIPFAEAHAEIVCICRKDAAVAVKELVEQMQRDHPINL